MVRWKCSLCKCSLIGFTVFSPCEGLKFSGVTGFFTMFQENIGRSRDKQTDISISENIGMI